MASDTKYIFTTNFAHSNVLYWGSNNNILHAVCLKPGRKIEIFAQTFVLDYNYVKIYPWCSPKPKRLLNTFTLFFILSHKQSKDRMISPENQICVLWDRLRDYLTAVVCSFSMFFLIPRIGSTSQMKQQSVSVISVYRIKIYLRLKFS